jgi:Leucine-rich repeat (LRR) protein
MLFPEDLPALLSPGQFHLNLADRDYRDVNSLCSDSLTSVNLSGNSLTHIDWGLKSLPKLQALSLAGNTLQNLEFLKKCSQLKRLDISDNHLSDTHLKQFCQMQFKQLQILVLSGNFFKMCETFLSSNFPLLEKLDLSHNFLQTIPQGALESLTKLKELILSYNSLRRIENISLIGLVSLDLSHNRITTVEEVSRLSKCTELTRFWFNDNQLNQRALHRIQCLVYLRTLRELDGKPVSESDLNQVKIILEQNSGISIGVQEVRGKGKVNNVILSLQPALPALQTSGVRRGRK